MKQGFTLIEILITLSAIVTLIGLLIYFVKPMELFKRHRDFQRINDLKNLELAIDTYLLNSPQPDLDGFYFSTGYDEFQPAIYISLPRTLFMATSIVDETGKEWKIIQNASDTNFLRRADGLGWLPINFTELKYPPINYLPVDPLNNLNFFYSYAFSRSSQGFELNARFEANIYNFGGSHDKASTDGGSDNEIYEAGINKCLIIGNKLYGEISTTTCTQSTTFQYPISFPKQACTNIQKITLGEWMLFDENDNLIPTDTSAVHDGSTSTSFFIGSLYIVHKFLGYHYLERVRVYSSYGAIGNAPYIKYYKDNEWKNAGSNENRECTPATTTYMNTTTIAWAVGWGGTVNVCEMEAYGCPVEASWFKNFGKDIAFYDIKSSKEKYLWNRYVLAGAKRINEYTYPYLAKIDLEGNIISSSTLNVSNATTSYFNIVLPLDDNKDGYIDNYLFGGIKKLENQNNALIMKITTNTQQIWSQEIATASIKAFEVNVDGNYIGVGEKNNLGYLFIFNSSTGNIIASTPLATSSFSFSDVRDIKRTENGFIVIGIANNKPTLATIDSNGNNLNFYQFECYLNLKSIGKTPYSNLYYIFVQHPLPSGESYFYLLKIAPGLSIISLIDIWDSREVEVSGQDVCNLPSSSNFKVFQNINVTDVALNSRVAGLGNEDKRVVFIKNGFLNYPLSIYLDSIGIKIIKNEDLLGYLIIGYENNFYGGFVMQVNNTGECLNCFASTKFYLPLTNVFYLMEDILELILHNLRFLP